jgi:RNA polymerase sigma-70 factor (ECF subfamily)
LFSWIYRIALNEAINQLNRRRKLEPLGEPPYPDGDVLQESLAASQLSHEVQAVLMELQEDQRTVIVLRYFTECSYRQIGEILELPEKTVKSRLFTARQQLKDLLQRHGMFGE